MFKILKHLSKSVVACSRFSSNFSAIEMKVLNVAEKNDAAKTLAGFMSSNIRRREGFSRFNKIYEFEYMLFGQKCDMIMTSVSGHLLGLEFVGSYRIWRSCNPLSLFEAPIVKQCIPGYEDIKRTLEREIRKCSVLIIWTDCDREGESIGFEIIEVCQAVKANIKIYRAKFSEITSQSVKRALQNLAQPDFKTNNAVQVRQELDLRIGAAFTRFQTLRLRQVFPQNLSDSLVSYGSCQFPTLGFVVERFKAIESFIPESFWKIKVIHEKNDLHVDFSWKRVRLFDELACQCFYDLCIENPTATVQTVTSKPKSRWRPLPLDTVELEKVGSRKLRINAKEIMKIAEKLYTQGFISYPRTETNIFPKEINLANLIGMQTADPAWGEFASRVLQDGPNPRNGTKSDKAHPPIHPIKYTSNLSGVEQRVYEFVVRRFLACCSKDAQGQETIVEINIADELFVANGLMITARNYLEVYPYDKWTAKEIHVYEIGEQFRPNIELVDGTTSPPKLLTEADLIALMEKHGIGTDATHAEHIEKIKSRLYVGIENEKFFVPGHLGMGLVEGYDSMGFPMSKPHLRAELEADLVKICEGKKNPEVVLKEQILKYKEVFEVALQQAAKIDEALAVYLQEQPCQPETNVEHSAENPCVYKCPACGSDMVLRTKRDGSGKFISCMSYPHCKTAVWFPSIVETVDISNETCVQCGPSYKKLKFKFRRGALPSYYLPEETSCIGGCDRDLLDILSINITNVQPNSNPSVGSTQSTNINSSSSSVNSSRGLPSSTSASNAFFPTRDQSLPSNNVRNPRQNARGRGRGGPEAGGQRSIRDIFQKSEGSSENTLSNNARVTQNAETFVDLTGDATVMCNCNENAIQLTVRKEGPNKGRPFYKCGNQSQCSFFQWADSAPSTVAHPQNSNDWNNRQSGIAANDSGLGRSVNTSLFGQTQFHRNTSHGAPADRFQGNESFVSGTSSAAGASRGVGSSSVNPPFNSSGRFTMQSNNNTSMAFDSTQRTVPAENAVVCACNENALLLTVKKDGPNKGRQFYKCGRDSTCNFFQWADNSTNNVQGSLQNDLGNSNSWQPRTGNVTDSASVDDNDDVRCRCGGPAKRLIVQKDGPNKGRPFYSCPKTVERCQFFMWADEGSSGNAGGSSSSNWGRNNQGGRGRGNSSHSSDGRKRRKCGNCHEEGHTKRSCPNN